jgi:hypothetical protein
MLPLRAGRRMCGKDAAEGRDGAYSAKMPLKFWIMQKGLPLKTGDIDGTIFRI